jgi:succinate-acetate transporter protein
VAAAEWPVPFRAAKERKEFKVSSTELSRPAAEGTSPAVVIADPAPLGLAAFALTTFILSTVNAGLLKAGVESIVLSSALFYGGVVQLLGGMWEFRRGNTFGATAFTSYGGFWLAFWGIGRFFAPAAGTSASDVNNAVGVFRTNTAVMAVFAVLTVTFLVLAIGKFQDSSGMTKLGGWLGLATAVLAWYASFAGVTNETWKRVVLPVWPRA